MWAKPGVVPAPGVMGVDFEERVDFARLRTYRTGCTSAALEESDLAALLLFDTDNIRYLSSTHIGEWARDKMTRFALLTPAAASRSSGTSGLPPGITSCTPRGCDRRTAGPA